MMKNLTSQEIDVAKKIISAGLVKSAESLSFFMNETITLKDFDAEKHLNNPPLELSKKDESNIHLLTTKVIGEMKGICCLIFSEEEADHLRKAALPQEILDSPEMMEEMSDGIMLEVDNIISASVITQFSNLLKVKIHGGVPSLKKVTSKEMEDFISGEVDQELYLISFKTSFESSKANFNPEFVWLFDNTFIDCIKNYIVQEA
jgi:chemotaxis protein CheY-P-specific phosphatase CheC